MNEGKPWEGWGVVRWWSGRSRAGNSGDGSWQPTVPYRGLLPHLLLRSDEIGLGRWREEGLLPTFRHVRRRQRWQAVGLSDLL